MRKLLIAGGVVLTVIIGGAVFLFSSMDSIVKKIIERHGGAIKVESNGQDGPTMVFTWPKMRELTELS